MVDEVADNGARQSAEDYVVAIAQERAEGMYRLERPGELVWDEPKDENCHLEISVCDAADKRFIPELRITATLVAATGESIGPVAAPFLWHPGLYHYGVSVRVPGDGRYTVRVRIEAPTFMRHDRVNGKRYANAVEVEFRDFKITPGRE